jgi:biotin synthase-like enzyme
MEMTSSSVLSYENDVKQSLRWVAIIKGLFPDVEISASTEFIQLTEQSSKSLQAQALFNFVQFFTKKA